MAAPPGSPLPRSFGTGPLGALRPWWHTPLLFLAGAAWGLILLIPGWLLAPHGTEQRSVADVYRALAGELRWVGDEGFAAARREVTSALNTAYDQLLSIRPAAGGRDRQMMRLVALLTQSHLLTEAVTAAHLAGNRPPPEVISATERLAEAIRTGAPPPIPPAWDGSPAAGALTGALAGAARLVRLSAVRLMVCIGVAALMSEVLPLQRSYWVVLTVAIVLKPDLGSVFARAVQRGIGTIVGAVLGALIVAAVPYGDLLLIPTAVLAAQLVRAPARPVRRHGGGGVRVPGAGAGRQVTGPAPAAPPGLPGACRPARRVSANLSEPPAASRRATAWWPRGGRPRTGDGRGHRGGGGRRPRSRSPGTRVRRRMDRGAAAHPPGRCAREPGHRNRPGQRNMPAPARSPTRCAGSRPP